MRLSRKLALGLIGGGGSAFWRTIVRSSPIAFWPLWESAGTTAQELVSGLNGVYPSSVSGWPVAASGMDGKTWPVFSGDDRVTVNSAGLSAAFNAAEGSITIYGKVDAAARWTDGVTRRMVYLLADSSNFITFNKSTTSNLITLTYRAAATNKAINISMSTTDMFSVTLTWSVSNDRVRAYLNGVQSGADVTTIPTWVGALGATCRIGVFLDNYADAWIGNLGYCAIWNRELTSTEVARVASLPPFSVALGFSDALLRFDWVTDTHVVAGSTTKMLNMVPGIEDANTWLPNALVHTGDIGNDAVPNTREAFTNLRMCHRPVIACNGNHDEEEITLGAGNPNTEPLYGAGIFNRNPFYYSVRMVSGDGSVEALCLILDNNIYDDDPGEVVISPDHAPGDRFGTRVGATDWWKRINPVCLTWIESTLSDNSDCDLVMVFVHHPPLGARFTNWAALVDLLQANGKPSIGFCGHVHADATSYTQTSTDTLYTLTVYKMPSTGDSGAYTRVTLSMSGGAIVIDGMVIYNYTDPGGWTINLPFTLAA